MVVCILGCPLDPSAGGGRKEDDSYYLPTLCVSVCLFSVRTSLSMNIETEDIL